MEFKYCFGYFSDIELDEILNALLMAFEITSCDKPSVHSCQECEHTHTCGFLSNAITVITDEKRRRVA